MSRVCVEWLHKDCLEDRSATLFDGDDGSLWVGFDSECHVDGVFESETTFNAISLQISACCTSGIQPFDAGFLLEAMIVQDPLPYLVRKPLKARIALGFGMLVSHIFMQGSVLQQNCT